MPNLVTHYLLARDVYERADGRISFLDGNTDQLYIGTQGPDILFYSYWSPTGFHPKVGAGMYGDQLHKENGEKLFTLFCERIPAIEDEGRRKRFESFVLGWLAHLILDRETHPMTFFLTGIGSGHLVRHSRLESAYASVQCRRRGEMDLLEHPVKSLPADNVAATEIDLDFVLVLESYFGREFPVHPIREGLRTFRLVTRIVASKGSLPIRFGMVRSLHMYPDVSDDCMNDDRHVWKDPETGFQRNDSFQDLFDRSEELVYQAAVDLQEKGFTMDTIRPYLTGINYDGYTPGAERKYFSADMMRKKW